jgi:1-acyl-sn-glycerol-3-phosphate acyltransferase
LIDTARASAQVAARRTTRASAIVALVLYGLVASCFLPLFHRSIREGLIRGWSKSVLRVLHLRAQLLCSLPVPTNGVLLSNHVSWLDIIVLNSLLPSRFVAKQEVRKWPVFGWLARQAGTVFVRRDRKMETGVMNNRLAELIRHGERLAVFPEGTTTDGESVLPFRSALLDCAVKTECAVYPVAVRYRTADGRLDKLPAFVGDDALGASLWRIFGQPELYVDLSIGQPLPVSGHRRDLAADAHAAVTDLLRQAEARRRHPVTAPEDSPPRPA